MLESWSADDFSPPSKRTSKPLDFWDPEDPRAVRTIDTVFETDETDRSLLLEATTDQPRDNNHQFTARWSDYDDPVPEHLSSPPAAAKSEPWHDYVPIDAYDPFAQEAPFVIEWPQNARESVATKCANAVLALASVTERERRRLFRRFVELFTDYPHPSSYLAITNLIRQEGASPDDLLAAYDLKQAWIDNPLFSLVLQKGGQVTLTNDRDNQLYWKLAFRLIIQTRGTPPETIIDPSWVEEWLDLPHGDPLRFRFLDYACARLEAFGDGALGGPPTYRRRCNHLETYPAGRLYPRFRYERDSLKDIATVDGYRLANNFSRTALLAGIYVNPIGHYASALKMNESNTSECKEAYD
jgi:hypothetical protein